MLLWICNAIGATAAVVANLWGARGAARSVRRAKHATAALAAVYAVGITWGLAFGEIEDWARVGRVVGPFAWVIVWVLPPLLARRERTRVVELIDGLAAGAREGR